MSSAEYYTKFHCEYCECFSGNLVIHSSYDILRQSSSDVVVEASRRRFKKLGFIDELYSSCCVKE